jgi:hypothetical protein
VLDHLSVVVEPTDLSNEATESLGDRTVGLGVAEARDEPAIYDREDGAFRLHRRPIFMSFRGLQAQS